MSLRFIPDALEDLRNAKYSGRQPRLLKKLAKIERDPSTVGKPLGRDLTTFRSVALADRAWRIIWRVVPTDTEVEDAVIWVIGDRRDDECYEVAKARLERLGDRPETVPAIRAFEQLLTARKQRRELDERGG